MLVWARAKIIKLAFIIQDATFKCDNKGAHNAMPFKCAENRGLLVDLDRLERNEPIQQDDSQS